MNKTVWKSEPEINCIIGDYDTFGIISCGTCANLSWTGGRTGLEIMEAHLLKRGKKIGLSRVVLACCPEAIMKRALKDHRRALGKCDALIVLSCAGGIKSANSCKPGLPVISVLDSAGSTAVACTDPFIARSVCRSCGHCVLSFTAGICPVSECAAKSKYGPCSKYSESDRKCALAPEEDCVWHVIRERSKNLDQLHSIRELHGRGEKGMQFNRKKNKPGRLKGFFAWNAAHIQSLERVIRLFR